MSGRAESKFSEKKSFIDKLNVVNAQAIPGNYCRTYLQHLLLHIEYYLEIYEQLFEIVQTKCTRDKSEISIVDYGSGNGLLGLYALHYGFKKVVLIDSDRNFVQASAFLSQQLRMPCDIIEGDVNELLSIPAIDAIVGTDVIEHIYNLDEMMGVVKKLNPYMVTVFTTASNPANYLKIRELMRLQLKDELEGNSESDPEYNHPPFLEIRRSIIRSALPDVDKLVIDQLAENTRGMSKQIYLQQYIYTKLKNKCP